MMIQWITPWSRRQTSKVLPDAMIKDLNHIRTQIEMRAPITIRFMIQSTGTITLTAV